MKEKPTHEILDSILLAFRDKELITVQN